MQYKMLVERLRYTVGNPSSYFTIWEDEDLDTCVDKVSSLEFVHIKETVEDPVLAFWKLVKAEVLNSICHVVFTGIKPGPGWRDLKELYDAASFGSIFLLTYDKSTGIVIMPSQRGIFNREEE